jgi:hypothetical protein
LRRLVVLSIILTVGGLLLLLPNSAFYNLITTGSASGSTATRFAVVSGTDNTSTMESLAGFALVGMGIVFEFLSLFTDVGGSIPTGVVAQPQQEEKKA